jgi:hypothetical protein
VLDLILTFVKGSFLAHATTASTFCSLRNSPWISLPSFRSLLVLQWSATSLRHSFSCYALLTRLQSIAWISEHIYRGTPPAPSATPLLSHRSRSPAPADAKGKSRSSEAGKSVSTSDLSLVDKDKILTPLADVAPDTKGKARASETLFPPVLPTDAANKLKSESPILPAEPSVAQETPKESVKSPGKKEHKHKEHKDKDKAPKDKEPKDKDGTREHLHHHHHHSAQPSVPAEKPGSFNPSNPSAADLSD